MIKGVIFDFDGVLVDSVDVKTRAFARLFEGESREVIDEVVRYHLRNTGISRVEKIRYYYDVFLNRPLPESELTLLCERFALMVVGEVVTASYIDGAIEFLDTYHNKLDLYVASGTPEAEMKEIVWRRRMSGFFKGVYGSPMKKGAIASNILSKNNYSKDDVIFVGDAIADFEGAKEAGIGFIGLIKERGKNIFPESVSIIESHKELPKILGLN